MFNATNPSLSNRLKTGAADFIFKRPQLSAHIVNGTMGAISAGVAYGGYRLAQYNNSKQGSGNRVGEGIGYGLMIGGGLGALSHSAVGIGMLIKRKELGNLTEEIMTNMRHSSPPPMQTSASIPVHKMSQADYDALGDLV